MADGTEATAAVSDDPAKSEEHEGESGADVRGEGGLTDAQTELLEKCLHSLKHAKNDSHTLAALLLVRLVNQSASAKTDISVSTAYSTFTPVTLSNNGCILYLSRRQTEDVFHC